VPMTVQKGPKVISYLDFHKEFLVTDGADVIRCDGRTDRQNFLISLLLLL
jgi:hypothetical protein